MSHLFLKPDAAAFGRLFSPTKARGLEEFTGLYARDNRVDSLGAIMRLDDTLAFEMGGRMVIRLRPTNEADRWVPERASNDSVTFRREDGRVTGLTLRRGERIDVAVRFRPDASLPTVDEN